MATFAAGLAATAEVRHPQPRLASVFPQGAERAQTLTVEVLGQNLDRAQTVSFAEPGISAAVIEAHHTRLRLQFSVAADAAWGPHYFQVVGPRGASNPGLFRVGDLPHRNEVEPNGQLVEFQTVAAPVTVNGRLDRPTDIDIFQFAAKAGQNWVFDVRSGRNGSGLDPSMILLDDAGRKLRHSEDHFIWDPFFIHQIERDGSYYVVLQPTRGRALPTHGYQLDIRRGPFVSKVTPAALPAGAETAVSVHGTGLSAAGTRLEFTGGGFSGRVSEAGERQARLRIQVPKDAPPGLHSFAVVTDRGRSTPTGFWVHALPELTPGRNPKPPFGFNGTASYRQPDSLSFLAAKGETLVFAVTAHRLGVPVDMTLKLFDEQAGRRGDSQRQAIAENDDAKLPGIRFNKDPVIVHKFREGGRYTVEARALTDVDGKDLPYFLAVRRPRPRMDLMLDAERAYIYPGQEGEIRVTANRRDGYSGGAELSIQGLPDGLEANPVSIPRIGAATSADPKPEKIKLAVKASELQPGTFARARVVDAASGGTAWSSVRIASGGGEGATQVRLDEVLIAVAERPEFSLEAGLRTVNLVRDGIARLPVAVSRQEDFSAKLQFSIENLPPGVTLRPVEGDSGGSEIILTLEAAADAQAGSFSDVTVLAASPDGRTEQAPPITLAVD